MIESPNRIFIVVLIVLLDLNPSSKKYSERTKKNGMLNQTKTAPNHYVAMNARNHNARNYDLNHSFEYSRKIKQNSL